jgi:amidase
MTFECSNPIFGRTINPLNEKLSPRGSSGGESALIAAKGSCLGLGSDGAGSLRIPAAFCGLYALKPSFGRLSLEGNGNEGVYIEFIQPCLGPLARNIEDLELFMQSATEINLDRHDWSLKYRKDFQPYQFKKKRLKIGYFTLWLH